MRVTSYKERSARMEKLSTLVADLDTGRWDNIIAYPLFVDILPMETVYTGFPNDERKAPSEPGIYELWHICHGSTHWGWVFKKTE